MENNNYRVVFSSDAMSDTSTYIQHYGKKGMKWGVVHEEIPGRTANSHATVFSFRGEPPRSMTGDNRVKATQTPSVSSASPSGSSVDSEYKKYLAGVSEDTNEVVKFLGDLDIMGVYMDPNDPNRGYRLLDDVQDPDDDKRALRNAVARLREMMHKKMEESPAAKRVGPAQYQRDFLSAVYRRTGVDFSKVISNPYQTYQKQAADNYNSSAATAKRQTAREFAKNYSQTMQRVRNPKSYWGVAKKKQVGGR